MRKRITLDSGSETALVYGFKMAQGWWDGLRKVSFTSVYPGRPYHGLRNDGGRKRVKLSAWNEGCYYGFESLI